MQNKLTQSVYIYRLSSTAAWKLYYYLHTYGECVDTGHSVYMMEYKPKQIYSSFLN